eukprot:2505539-Prymnesium_polylepis.2
MSGVRPEASGWSTRAFAPSSMPTTSSRSVNIGASGEQQLDHRALPQSSRNHERRAARLLGREVREAALAEQHVPATVQQRGHALAMPAFAGLEQRHPERLRPLLVRQLRDRLADFVRVPIVREDVAQQKRAPLAILPRPSATPARPSALPARSSGGPAAPTAERPAPDGAPARRVGCLAGRRARLTRTSRCALGAARPHLVALRRRTRRPPLATLALRQNVLVTLRATLIGGAIVQVFDAADDRRVLPRCVEARPPVPVALVQCACMLRRQAVWQVDTHERAPLGRQKAQLHLVVQHLRQPAPAVVLVDEQQPHLPRRHRDRDADERVAAAQRDDTAALAGVGRVDRLPAECTIDLTLSKPVADFAHDLHGLREREELRGALPQLLQMCYVVGVEGSKGVAPRAYGAPIDGHVERELVLGDCREPGLQLPEHGEKRGWGGT